MTANERQQLPVTDTDGNGDIPHFRDAATVPKRAAEMRNVPISAFASLAARGVLTLAIAAALSACAGLPQSGARPQVASAADYVSSQSLAAPVGVWPAESWWESYGDPQLSSLIAEGLAGSPDIAVAEARLAPRAGRCAGRRRCKQAAGVRECDRDPAEAQLQLPHSARGHAARLGRLRHGVAELLVAARFLGPQSRGDCCRDLRYECDAGRSGTSAAHDRHSHRIGLRRAGASALGA